MRARVRRPAPPEETEDDGPLAELFADRGRARTAGAKRAKPLADIDAAILSAEARAQSGDWDGADSRVLLGLYAWCHRSVYGITPVELEAAGEFRIASRAALRILHERFSDDPAQCAIFIRWTWKREKERAAWAAREKKDRNRLGWRLQFSDRQVTDFLVAAASKRGT